MLERLTEACTKENMGRAHALFKFFNRTVLVKNNDVDAAYRALDRFG